MANQEVSRDGEGRPRPLAPLRRDGLGDVARDAIDHATVIVRDTVALGKLEAQRLGAEAAGSVRAALPLVALGATAALLGLVGVVLGLIAIFLALGDPVPSVGWRLAIFALVFLAVASLCAAVAASMRGPQRRPPHPR